MILQRGEEGNCILTRKKRLRNLAELKKRKVSTSSPPPWKGSLTGVKVKGVASIRALGLVGGALGSGNLGFRGGSEAMNVTASQEG